jgi:hypothetical protein
MQRALRNYENQRSGGLYLIRLRSQIRSRECLRPEPLLFNNLQAFEFRVPTANSRRVRFGKELVTEDTDSE